MLSSRLIHLQQLTYLLINSPTLQKLSILLIMRSLKLAIKNLIIFIGSIQRETKFIISNMDNLFSSALEKKLIQLEPGLYSLMDIRKKQPRTTIILILEIRMLRYISQKQLITVLNI